jgi:membrane-associated phospholipid phosphatase
MDGKKAQGQGGKSGKQLFPRALLWIGLIIGVWIVAVTFMDMPIYRYFDRHKLSSFVKETAVFFDCYNNPVPLILLAATAAISIGAERWRMIGHLILGAAISGGLVWIGKLLVSRQRPKWFKGSSWHETFTGFWPGLGNMKFQSLPSGDAALAFAVSFILARYFPRHRYILYILAIGCAFSRVVLKYHYLSDVILGAALGYLAARIVLFLSTPAGNK